MRLNFGDNITKELLDVLICPTEKKNSHILSANESRKEYQQYLEHCLIIKKKTYTLHIYIKDLFHKQSITLIPQREKKIKRK